jgi:hypothetical protein
MLPFLFPVIFTFEIHMVLKFKRKFRHQITLGHLFFRPFQEIRLTEGETIQFLSLYVMLWYQVNKQSAMKRFETKKS